MRKLALRDEILLQIDKAARYIGGEVNAVMKNKDDVDIRFAMAFPDVYEIGMSNLGMMILYNMFNQREDVWCERLAKQYPEELSAYTCRLKLYFIKGDKEHFFAVMDQLKKSDTIIDNETLELIRVFS